MKIFLGVLIFFAFPALAQKARVTDGDTLALDGTTWRLWGIDAPEGGQLCRREDISYDCGNEATAALIRIIGESVPVCRHKDTDRYGRTVGQCFVDGQDVGALLVRQGMGARLPPLQPWPLCDAGSGGAREQARPVGR